MTVSETRMGQPRYTEFMTLPVAVMKIPVRILQTRKSVRQWESQIGLFRQAVTTSSEHAAPPSVDYHTEFRFPRR